MQVVLFGATGHLGRFVRRELAARGHATVAVARSQEGAGRMRGDLPPRGEGEVVVSPLESPTEELREAVRRAEGVVVCVPIQLAAEVVAALKSARGDTDDSGRRARVVVISSMRAASRVPDPSVDAVRAGEAAWRASGFAPMILRATMIFGGPDDRNLSRVMAWARRHRWIPLPTGRLGMVQPIWAADVARAIVAALELDDAVRDEIADATIELGGETPITLRELLTECYRAAIGRDPICLPVPVALLHLASLLQRVVPLGPRITGAQLARLREDKIVDLTPARTILGFSPTSLHTALAGSLMKNAP